MRHKKSFNHLSRKSAHRKAMLANMASSLIIHKRIHTTTAKAKALKKYIEPLITRSRDDSTHSRRMVFSYLQDKEAVSELFREVAVKVGDRPGGYTRIIRIGSRQGDNADICMMELVDYNPTLLAEKAATRKTSRRRRGGRGKSAEKKAEPVAAAEQATPEAEPVEEPEAEAEEIVESEPAEQLTPEAEPVEEPEAETEEPKAEKPQAREPKAESESEEPQGQETKAETKEPKTEESKTEAGPAKEPESEESKTEEEKKDDQSGEEENKD